MVSEGVVENSRGLLFALAELAFTPALAAPMEALLVLLLLPLLLLLLRRFASAAAALPSAPKLVKQLGFALSVSGEAAAAAVAVTRTSSGATDRCCRCCW